jgi:hypothetical protein
MILWVVTPCISDTVRRFGKNIASIFSVEEEAKQETSITSRQAQLEVPTAVKIHILVFGLIMIKSRRMRWTGYVA